MNEKDIAEQAYKNGYDQALKDMQGNLSDEEIVKELQGRVDFINEEFERTKTPINFMMIGVDAVVVCETLDFIHRLQVKKQKYADIASKAQDEQIILVQENELLTDTLNQYINGELINAETMGKIISLENQVDELTAFKNEAISMSLYGKGRKDGEEVAVKATAKEICDLILEHWEKKQFVECDWLRVAISERYGVEVE